jgi:hypothetical protein
MMISKISISDNDYSNSLTDCFATLRNEIAIAIHSGQGDLINYLNSRNQA